MHSQEEPGELRNCSEMKGGPDPSISLERENKMNLEVLDIEPSHAEAEIFDASNDPFNSCEDYLLGVIQETECWSDLLEMTDHDIHQLSNDKFEDKMLVEDNCMSFPTSFTSGDIDYLENVSSFLPESISSDNNDEDAIFTPALTSSGSICVSTTIEQNKELSIGGPNVDHESLYLHDSSTKNSSQDSNCRTQRRVRKPTRRYIDESADLNTRRVRKKVEVSTSLSKEKCHRVKYSKKPDKPLALEFQPEETLCEAIQVPFGPLVPEECHMKHPSSSVVKVKSNEIPLCGGNKDGDKKHASDVKKVKLNELSSVGPEKCHQKYEMDVNKVMWNKTTKAKHVSGLEECYNKNTSNQNHISSFGSEEYLKSPACGMNKVLKSDEEMSVDESDDGVTTLRSDGYGARRKHHRLWTVSEVRKLIDGVSQCGVGRWSQIKRLFFSSSDHRTPVDLKDKWRNLLKATHLQNQSKKAGKGKQNFSWRPLPKPILHRVVELASVHPYPRNCKSKT